ncbi:Two-component system protein A 1 [Pleurostoma richardsiae]|uniref:histidine kinase n=1 Tax=Pleurostoma richardsiae TaxID=41990 RepID=A0AA38RVS2_9PEZI|nr:Two-component system protein A 1 [Pleurostoma richardsiae]
MEGSAIVTDNPLDPPSGLFTRLRQIVGYTWDESKTPFHSTYDNWHVFGTRFVSPFSTTLPHTHNVASPSAFAKLSSGSSRLSPSEYSYMSPSQSEASSQATSPPIFVGNVDSSFVEEPVVARISYHVLREERAFHITNSLALTADPTGEHIVKPLDLVRLSPQPGDRGAIVVAIYQTPGPNYIHTLLDLGPAFYYAHKLGERWVADLEAPRPLDPPISLQDFMDFAIGATQCLEIIHHGQGIVHGEIRGDSFHFSRETTKVKLISFGSGLRSFEHGLTSSGWSHLSKEIGAKNKLLYISPEQTGRMPAEPDTRTDIYSLGVLFWTLLTQQPVFEGETPLDIVQGVLGRRIPNVSTIRMDVPDVLGRIVQKCTAKNVADRYQSASGLRHDLVKVQEFLSEGDWLALKEWQIASKDVSSFFMLPNLMIGRAQEREVLLKVIDRVAKSHAISHKAGINRFSDGSTLSTEFLDGADASSEGASSEGGPRGSGSFTATIASDLKSRNSLVPSNLADDSQTISGQTMSSGHSNGASGIRISRPWERHQSVSFDTKSLADSLNGERESSRQAGTTDSSSSLSKKLGSAKFRRRGHCEVVTIEGAGGLGKSCLVHSVLAEARRRGYCATAKFDTARRTAYGPLLKLLSSLFRQVWGERNTETPFHQALKQYVRPMWPMLHKVLGLPEFLLGPVETVARSGSTTSGPSHTRSLKGMRRRGSSPASSAPGSSHRSSRVSNQMSQDFLRAGASTKSIRLMNTILDVLRVFTDHKFICFSLEDLHFADEESLELITQIIGARMKMVIVMTYRSDELSPERVQSIISPPDSDDSKSGGPIVTRITLSPLSEEEIVKYVSTTLCRPPEDILPLALVIQSKSGGNPFYMREMLSACHRKGIIWYEYKNSEWEFDLDKLFHEFKGEADYDVLNTEFITRRLNELPPAARSLLAWAALLGHSFSFELICHLLSGESQYMDDQNPQPHALKTYSPQDAVAGLQAALQAFIIMPSETDDRFRFAHDRYVQAALELRECNSNLSKMHFVIASTLMKHYSRDPKAREAAAAHICEAVDIIRRHVRHRGPYRQVLFDCAKTATERGARPTAAKFYTNAVALLQSNPWEDGAEDVSYEETTQLYLRAADCWVYMGNHGAANALLATVLASARTPLDKAPASLLQSRIYAQSGDAEEALDCLKRCLKSLDVEFDETPTFEKCDAEFEQLSVKIQTTDRAEILSPKTTVSDAALPSIATVLVEGVSNGWWSDCPSFYELTLTMVKLHFNKGAYPQSGMGFLYLAMIALSRFTMVQFAADLSSICLDLIDQSHDPFPTAKAYMIYANFVGHIQWPIGSAVNQLEGSVEYAAAAGDRISSILSFGLLAQLKFFASENYADLEAFWVRQVCRALQGKTRISDANEVMSDDQHNANAYKAWLKSNTNNGGRSVLFYETLEMVPLFLYGHYERAVELGRSCLAGEHLIWSARNTRLVMVLYGLSVAGMVIKRKHDPRTAVEDLEGQVKQTIEELEMLNKKIKDWEVITDVNYAPWSKMLEGQIFDLRGDHGSAVSEYEQGLDAAAENNFMFEEALGNYLMAGVFIRKSARRSAISALREAVSLYRQLGANGVADRIEFEHSLLLHGPTRNPRTAEAGVQTDFAGDAAPVQYRTVDGEVDEAQQAAQAGMVELKGQRLGEWRGSMQPVEGGNLPALDIIDLHTILVSSQVISSVLKVDDLLKTMCDVILQTCGGSATMAAIVVQEEDQSGWCVAASGDPERRASTHVPRDPLSGTSLVAENVVLYCTRFREVVFIADILTDERFGNVAECWLKKNPLSKAIIAMPIGHGSNPLLGVLYLEGMPHSFTDRNVSVLQLLVNQIGISYSNALSLKAIEKVSAENVSMVALQKRALAKAIQAEAKAKAAEAEAKRNVKLAEEAAKAKAIFLANVSHELRTPLNGVIGNSELLRDSNLNKDQLEMADSIRVSADLLLTVINDILDFSKMEADKMTLYIIAFNPEEMVREVVRAVSYSNREKTSKKNVKIIQDINLPPMLIYGDPIRLHQVMGNLIGNSLKFTEDGSITIGAKIDSDTDEKATLTFWVKDTGIGIPPRQLAKLFQPFSQADASTARKYGGSGLGLSICKSLIETMMKGKIQLESQENVGTTAWFTVTFDKAKPEVIAGDAQHPALPAAPPSSRSRAPSNGATSEPEPSSNPYVDLHLIPRERLRICIAEDNLINQKIAIQYVLRLGYSRVDAYDNGLKAVEGLRQKAKEGDPYHVILMDVQMPVLDGYEATKLIRKDPIEAVRKVLVIAMTASAIQGDREKCLAAGMNDYLAKPVRSDVLKRKLDTYTGAQASLAASTSVAHSATRYQHSPGPESDRQQHNTGATPSHTPSPSLSRSGDSSATSVTVPIRDSAACSTPSELRPTPSQASSDSRLSDAGSIGETTSAKRQPRKLTKARNGEPSTEKLAVEKPKAVLQKRNTQRRGSVILEGNESADSLPPGSKKPADGLRSFSFGSSLSSGSKEKLGQE